MPDHVIVQFQMHKRGRTVDLELPLDMTARESVTGKRRITISWISRPLAVIPQSPLMKAERNDA